MRIHSDFECGNIRLLKVDGDTVYLKNDLRDTDGDWFYWAFCVEGAQGKTLTFAFDKNWVGYFGAAVSHDGISWHWSESRISPAAFTYTFRDDEYKVFFAHDLVYSPSRLFSFLCETGLQPQVLCKSPKGRDVPLLSLGLGDRVILVTSRHHACESTGTYVLEGFLREFLEFPLTGYRLLVVPFVDCDGVYDGDQGKNRAPHDHNRDYCPQALYPETKSIMDLGNTYPVFMGFDFHSPYHLGKVNDHLFIVRKFEEKTPLIDGFGEVFRENCNERTLIYEMKYDVPANTGWNQDSSPTFATHFNRLQKCRLAFSLETPYFGTAEDRVSEEKLIATGRAFCKALREYLLKLC